MDADLIVRAVNSHAALVEACEAMLECIENSSSTEWGDTKELRKQDRKHWAEAIDHTRAALALAKEQS